MRTAPMTRSSLWPGKVKRSGPWLLIWALAGTACERAPTLRFIPSPAAPGSAEPNLAAGADGNLYLSWVETEGDSINILKFSRWEDPTWSEPRTISMGRDWFVNWADFPAFSALDDGTLAAHWLAKTGSDTYSYGVHISLSSDGGDTWSPPIVPHRDRTQTEHGFVSLLSLSGDSFGVVWLDGRETAAVEHGDGDGSMALRYTSVNREGNLDQERLLDSRVCDCCQTDARLLDDGTVLVVYRDRSDSEIRDISLVRLEKGGALDGPHAVHADGWEINGCPVNGPALTTQGKDVAVAWFTAGADDSARVLVAFSADGGRVFGDPIRVDGGRPLGRVDAEFLDDGRVHVVWLEQSGEAAEILIRTAAGDGELTPPVLLAASSPSRAGGFPRMARWMGGFYLAWTEVGEPTRVMTAVYR